jgi:hypothetical protein
VCFYYVLEPKAAVMVPYRMGGWFRRAGNSLHADIVGDKDNWVPPAAFYCIIL